MARLRSTLGSGSAEDFPYDSSLKARHLEGLDRLRAIPDRTLAQYMYLLHVKAERNERHREKQTGSPIALHGLRCVATRALVGDLGADARELAAYILLDDAGRERTDPASLQTFYRGFRELRRASR